MSGKRPRRRAFGWILASLAALVLLAFSVTSNFAAPDDIPVTITIFEVDAFGRLEGDLRGAPDLYAGVTIDGEQFDSFDIHVDDKDPITPFWTFTKNVSDTRSEVDVIIEIWEHDGCDNPFCSSFTISGRNDDHGDVDLDPDDRDLHLTIDLATGKWSGDVSWPRNCSTGDGSNGVKVCWDASVISASGDADGDALLDGWELNGFDGDNDGTVDVDLSALGADPQRQDLFLELDCLVSDGNGNGNLADPQDHSHCPNQNAVLAVVQAFANAPTTNPDGTNGIELHVDTGALYGSGLVATVSGTGGVIGTYGDLGGGGTQIAEAGNQVIDYDGASGRPGTDFFSLKSSNFNSNRAFIFRYGIFGHQTNARSATLDCTSGVAEGIGGNDFMVTLGGRRDVNGDGTGDTGCWGMTAANGIDEDLDGNVDEDPPNGVDDDGDCFADSDGDGNFCDSGDVNVDEDGGFSIGSVNQQAGALMHEFGHLLRLEHGGDDGVNFKPNYLSVMNYSFWNCSVPAGPTSSVLPGGCDFSRDQLNPLVESFPPGLDECVGVNGLYGLGPTDWNGDGNFTGISCTSPNVVADVNNDGSNSVLRGFDDWANIFFKFATLDRFANGVADPVEDEPTPELVEEAQAFLSDLLQPNLALAKDGATEALPGDVITYELEVTNDGAGPATQVVLTDTLPDGSQQVFNLGTIPADSSVTKSLAFTVPFPISDGMVLTNSAQVEGADIVGAPEQDTSDNSASFETTVTAPEMVLSKDATTTVAPGDAITFVITYENVGSADAKDVAITDTLPEGVHYDVALDEGAGPKPDSVAVNPDGTTSLSWTFSSISPDGLHTIEYTARPGLLFAADEVENSVSLDFSDANGNDYEVLSTSATTDVVVEPPSEDPRSLGFWRTHPQEWTAEILARIQATDTRFDGADGSTPDGVLEPSEVEAVLNPGGNQPKVLSTQLLATYLNLATRRINAGTEIQSETTDDLGLTNVREAVVFATDTLALTVDRTTRGRYEDATEVLDEINNNLSEVY